MPFVQDRAPRQRKAASHDALPEVQRQQPQPIPDYMDSKVYSEAVARIEEKVERMVHRSKELW